MMMVVILKEKEDGMLVDFGETRGAIGRIGVG